jgi:sensor domain CHASE-containing protein/signal transduction histidine kinase
MKLRKKAVLFTAIGSIILFIALSVGSVFVVRNGFKIIEDNLARKNISRVISTIGEKERSLVIKSADWAKWDDLYDFVNNYDSEFVTTNLNGNTISDLQLNFMYFIDTRDSIVYKSIYDNTTSLPDQFADELSQELLQTYKLTRSTSSNDIKSGIVVFKNILCLLVSRPILKSDGSGSSHGTLIFGIFLDQSEINRLIQIANVQFEIRPATSDSLPDDMRDAQLEISNLLPMPLKVLNRDFLAGYATINDIQNQPKLVLKITMERAISKQANATITFLHAMFLIIGIIYCIFFTIIIEKTVTSKITILNNEVDKITSSGDQNLRVTCTGNDELTLFSHSINTMLETLAINKREIDRHNYEMRLIMDTLQVGLFSINEDFIINPVHSKSSEVILGVSPLAGRDIFSILQIPPQSKQYSDFNDFLALLKIGALPDSEMQGLNPCDEIRFSAGDTLKWLRLEFFQMHRSDQGCNHILVEVKDITHEKNLTEKIKKSEQENIQLKAIAEDPDLFKEYLFESVQILEQTDNIIQQIEKQPSMELVHEAFRYIHLLKGSSDSFGMVEFAEAAGILEDQLDKLRNSVQFSQEDLCDVTSALLTLSQILYHTINEVKAILGDVLLLEQPQIILRLPFEKLQSEYEYSIRLLSEKMEPQCQTEVLSLISEQYRHLRLEPARKGFSKAFKAVPSLIKRLNKNCVFIVKGEDCLVDCLLSRKLNEPIIHIIRNAFDHGIEEKWERLEIGKEETAKVICSIRRDAGSLVIEISDDGRGINLDKVKETALKKGLLTEEALKNLNRESIINLIFIPGFSTCDAVSMTSGRGVGLNSVYQVIKTELSGSIKIYTNKNNGTTFTLTIPEPEITI